MKGRIGILATVLHSTKITGIERYALEFLRSTPRELRSNVVVLGHPGGRASLEAVTDGMQVVYSPFQSRILTDQIWVPYVIRKHKLDGVYNLTLSHPWLGFGSLPHGIVVHDATPWKYPETTSKGMKYYYRAQLDRALKSKRLQFVITVSQSSKQDIQSYCSVLSDIIVPIPLAVDTSVYRPQRDTTGLPELALENDKFILAVGTLEPRKNLQALMRAFSLVSRQEPDYRLIVVGRQGWQEKFDIPESLRDKVTFTGFIETDELVSLYSRTSLFVFPSLYEGFGIPMLEAMACGAPVLAANTSSLPEVGGEACLYADPTSDEDIAGQMLRIIRDARLRKSLSEEGLRRVKDFDWKRTSSEGWRIILKTLAPQKSDTLVTHED